MRRLRAVSEQRDERAPQTWVSSTLDELARVQNAQEVSDPHQLAGDIWESDEELDVFLADLRASRHASLA